MLALTVLTALAAGCGPDEPAAELAVEPADVVLGYPETAELEATWTPAAPIEHPIVFVHLLNAQGDLVRTFDLQFPGEWRVGQPVSHPVPLWQSALAPPLPAGDYELTMGVYEIGGSRPPLVAAGREVDDGEYAVARVEVPPPPVGGARLRLDEGWEPAPSGGDRQTIGSRWLRADGVLEVGGVGGPLDVTVTLRLPDSDEMSAALVLDEGATSSTVTITAACGADPVKLTEPGFHEVELALRPATGEAACPIAIDPNYVYVDPVSLRRLSVELRRVVWQPAGPLPAAAAAGAAAVP